MKCNYDVSHYGGDNVSGIGWIIRDDKGVFLDCGMGKFQGRNSVEEAEFTALLRAVQSTWELGYRMVIFEGDNTTINRLLNGHVSNTKLHPYMHDTKEWIRMFHGVKFSFNFRCADLLARKSITSPHQ